MGHSINLLAFSRECLSSLTIRHIRLYYYNSVLFGLRLCLTHVFPPLLITTSTRVARRFSGKENTCVNNNRTTEDPILGDCLSSRDRGDTAIRIEQWQNRISNAHDGDYTLWIVQRQGI